MASTKTEPGDVSVALAQLSAASDEVCVLDHLHVPYAHPGSGPAAKFGLGVELFLPNRDRAQLRQQAFELLLDFWTTFPDCVSEYLRRDTRRAKRFKGSPAQLIRDDIDRFPIETGHSSALYGSVDIGLEKDDIDPYAADVLVSRAGDPRLGFFHASMPLCSSAGLPRFELLVESVLRWSEIAQPAHGSAGFTFIVASGMSQNSRLALQMLERFPGFDFPDPISFTMEVGEVDDKIKCVNWLTVLGDAVVRQLGGLEAMQRGLESSCRLHTYRGGVVIQAGAAPRLGDAQKDDTPEPYRVAARLTQAVRFEAYEDGLFRVPAGRDKRQTTVDWVGRFD